MIGHQINGHKGFVIDGLTRTGSTTLARVLGCHPEIKCLMEPFHPRRYGGQFHEMAAKAQSVEPALNLIWHRWPGLKHVWDATTGWPFVQSPALNDGVVLGASQVIFLQRRNLLRRYVSDGISKQLNFWIGTRHEFSARLESTQLRELHPRTVRREIDQDWAAVKRRLQLIQDRKVPVLQLFYEDIYGEDATATRQFEIMNSILLFLGFPSITQAVFAEEWAPHLDPDTYRWGSAETYRLVPGIDDIERQVGSDETGWLFQ